jgi:hypothetical protein
MTTDNIESQEAIPAREALANPGELPMATPGITQPTTEPATAPAQEAPRQGLFHEALALKEAESRRDRKGAAWDPTKHESPPRQKRDGSWARLRGNAALKAAGKPLAGISSLAGRVIPPAAPPDPATIGTAPAAPPVADSFLAPEPAAATPDAIQAELIPARTLESYRATAETLTRGTFGAARLAFGPAWEPDRQEREEWNTAWQRVAHAYQWPYLPPWLELVILAVFSISKRTSDQTTKERWAAFVEIFKRRPPPPPPPPAHDFALRPAAPPAAKPAVRSPYDALNP